MSLNLISIVHVETQEIISTIRKFAIHHTVGIHPTTLTWLTAAAYPSPNARPIGVKPTAPGQRVSKLHVHLMILLKVCLSRKVCA